MSRNALTRQASFFLFLHDRSAKKFSFRITSFCVPLLLRALSLDGAWKNKKEKMEESKESSKSGEVRCSPALRASKFHANIPSSLTTIGDLCIIQRRRSGFILDSVFTQFQNSVRFSEKKFFGRTEKMKRRRRTFANDDDGWINNFFC